MFNGVFETPYLGPQIAGAQSLRRESSFYEPRSRDKTVLGFGVEIEIISLPLDELVLCSRDQFQLKHFNNIAKKLRGEGEEALTGLDPKKGDSRKWYITQDLSLRVDREDQGSSPQARTEQ